METYDLFLQSPFTMVIAGATGSGKSFWVKKLIEEAQSISKPPPSKIIYFYGEYQPIFGQMEHVNFIHGLSEELIANIEGGNENIWVIIDDLMSESSKSSIISDLFTKGSHHRNISIILIVQNFFQKGREMRNITLNAQYIVLFKNVRDRSLASNLARQMYPDRVRSFQRIFEEATKDEFSYLFIDLKPRTPEEIRLRSHVLGEKNFVPIYSI